MGVFKLLNYNVVPSLSIINFWEESSQFVDLWHDIKSSFAEVIEYARKIGINVDKEAHLIYLAREGLLRGLPAEWKPW